MAYSALRFYALVKNVNLPRLERLPEAPWGDDTREWELSSNARTRPKPRAAVSGKQPEILHSNGASNGRLYVAKNPGIHILMSNPTVVGAHTDEECVVAASLEPYYQLVLETALL